MRCPLWHNKRDYWETKLFAQKLCVRARWMGLSVGFSSSDDRPRTKTQRKLHSFELFVRGRKSNGRPEKRGQNQFEIGFQIPASTWKTPKSRKSTCTVRYCTVPWTDEGGKFKFQRFWWHRQSEIVTRSFRDIFKCLPSHLTISHTLCSHHGRARHSVCPDNSWRICWDRESAVWKAQPKWEQIH